MDLSARGLILAVAIMALGASRLAAETLLRVDFQDGKAPGWVKDGDGDVRLTRYRNNISLRVTQKASATMRVETQGYAHLAVTASLAAQNLGPADSCSVAVSTDDGAAWTKIIAVTRGQDDGVTLHAGAVSPPGAENSAQLRLRIEAAGGPRAICWADNISVFGQPLPSVEPADLTQAQLTAGAVAPRPRDLSAFAPPRDAGAPSHRFPGRLTLSVDQGVGAYRPLDDEALGKSERLILPAFDFIFVSDGADLVPVRRGSIPSTNPDWEWVLEPGKIWDQPGDVGVTRAAIPFALEERTGTCLHNGVLTFAYDGAGKVSPAAYEIASETCAFRKFDAWGSIPARVSEDKAPDPVGLIARFRREVAARLPVRPLSALAVAYPGFKAEALRLANPLDDDVPTAFGLVLDGVHYAAACETRHGNYPFCDVLDLPSYSTAKSIFAAVALMRLEALHPGASNEPISAHVPACATAAWRGVTFGEALNMATGLYASTKPDVDENAASTARFLVAPDHAGKIALACGQYPRQAEPGAVWVYHTSDTYALGAAMADYLRRTPGGDLYDDLVAGPIWRELGLSPTLDVTRRTYDALRQPFMGWGLTYHRDDILRIAGWLQTGARIRGASLLDDAMLRAALQRDPHNPGLSAGDPHFRYQNGFWARDIAPLIGCATSVWTPFMSGYGGISVVMFRNGVITYMFADSGQFDWAGAAVEVNRIKPLCP